MLCLESAIKHAEDVAKEQDKLSKRYDDASGYSRSHNDDIRTSEAKECERCAEDHRQLAEWLKDYKKLKEQELCEDAISRQAAIDIVDSYSESQSNVEDVTQDIISDIMVLPPVTQQPKIGHWIDKDIRGSIEPYCSVCGDSIDTIYHYNYCPNCGAKMVEPQESEDV